MGPESIQGLTVPRELVLEVLRGEERLADVRRLRVLAALARDEAEKDAA